MKRVIVLSLLVVTLLFATGTFALDRQPNATYRARREALARKADGRPILVFARTESDLTEVLTGFRQDDDFWYLTGVNTPGAAVLIVPAWDARLVEQINDQLPLSTEPVSTRPYSEVLLLPERNLAQEKWTGRKLGPHDAEAKSETGFDRVVAMEELRDEVAKVTSPARREILVNEGASSKLALDWLKRMNLSLQPKPLQPLTESLRVVKDAGEVALIRKAAEASVAAHLAAMKAIRPGMSERQVASLMVYEFERRGCERPAYGPIVGAGFNSTVLHYDEDSGPIRDGDLVLMDVAGEYSMYASDVTRTVPANGRFSPRQREIYDIVLGAQQAAIRAFKAGESTLTGRGEDSLYRVAFDYINSHGKDREGQPLGKYFIHGLGHMVGLDVHDPGTKDTRLQPGMVFTLEPGIYIPEEKIGVRIEDDFLVKPDGSLECLSCGAPKGAAEIERLMGR